MTPRAEIAGAYAERRIRSLAERDEVRRAYVERGGALGFLESVGATPWVTLAAYVQVLDAALEVLGERGLRTHARVMMQFELDRGRFAPLAAQFDPGKDPRVVLASVAPMIWRATLRHAGELVAQPVEGGVDLYLAQPPRSFRVSSALRHSFAGGILGVLDAMGLKARLEYVDREDRSLLVRARWDARSTTGVGIRRPPSSVSPRMPEGHARFRPGDALAGRYRIVKLLGTGSYGQVWKATDEKLGRSVAVKLLHGHVAQKAWARLVSEARILANLRHPNIVTIYNLESAPGLEGFLVLELLRGASLSTRLKTKGPLGRRSFEAVSQGLLRALAAAHKAGVVHRDLKPHNVLFDNLRGEEVHVKLIDFGLAGRVESSRVERVGTRKYMAPEQLRGVEPDIRTDVYGAAATLFHALAGRPPFVPGPNEDDVSFLRHIEQTPPPRLRGAPPELERVLHRGLAKRPEERFPTCDVMWDALEAALPPLEGSDASG